MTKITRTKDGVRWRITDDNFPYDAEVKTLKEIYKLVDEVDQK